MKSPPYPLQEFGMGLYEIGICGFRFDPATYSESYPATVPIIIRPPFRKLSGHCSDLIRPHLVVEDQ
ncbi:MAG: hypothetical protein P4M13_06515, partial [Alphaproteobacteria bacterium]|nr:hypothetical protein [Alphaproteobacteria bacterium]